MIALGPVGLGIAGAAVLGYGAWSAGNYLWDHRQQIADFTTGAANWVGDTASDAYNATSDAVSDATNWAGGPALRRRRHGQGHRQGRPQHSELRAAVTAPVEEIAGPAVPVEVLTDEELSVVASAESIVVLPFLDLIEDDSEREVARRTAYRSLLARGIVDPPSPEATSVAIARGDGRVELMVRNDVRSVVALREAARMVVAIARTTAAAQDFWYAHVVDDVVLLEEVSGDGLHRFALANAVDLPELAAAASVHPEAGDAEGEPVELGAAPGDPTPPDELLERLGSAILRSDVLVRHVGDAQPVLLGLFTGPAGSWVTRAEQGTPPWTVPSAAGAARAAVRDLVDDAFAQVTIRGL